MASSVWYSLTGSSDGQPGVEGTGRRKRGRPRKTEQQGEKRMSTTKTVTMTVLDVGQMADVKLQREVELPAKPQSVEEALEAVGNDKAKLIDIIYDGLVSDVCERAKASADGWMTTDAEGEVVPYTGTYADETQGKAIALTILNMAKACHGYSNTMTAEQKRASKAAAFNDIRASLLAGLAPKPAPVE